MRTDWLVDALRVFTLLVITVLFGLAAGYAEQHDSWTFPGFMVGIIFTGLFTLVSFIAFCFKHFSQRGYYDR